MTNLTGNRRAGQLMPDPVLTPAEIDALVAPELERVEELFRDQLGSPLRIIDEIGDFVAVGGGKRVRPKPHLLSARLCGYEGPHDVLIATVLEFIHSATLIHDDIIDGATTRRGLDSVNFRWGNNVTVLFGDYLFAKAMEMALRAGSLDVMQRLADVTLRMTEGEMLQTRYAGRLDLSVDEYLDLVQRKTAALFGCCCELGAMLAGVDDARRQAMRDYGLALGMAFQLVDDLLDLTSDSETLGKPVANDLRDGKPTLAVLELLRGPGKAASEGRELVRAIMAEGRTERRALERLGGLLRDSGALGRARDRAEAYAASCIERLTGFSDGPAKRALRTLPELLLVRDR